MLRHGQQYSLTFEWLLFTAMLDLTQNTIDNSWNDHGGLCLFLDRFNGKMESWLPTRPCVCSARLLLNLTAFALSLLESSAPRGFDASALPGLRCAVISSTVSCFVVVQLLVWHL